MLRNVSFAKRRYGCQTKKGQVVTPYNQDGSLHDCKKKNESKPKQENHNNGNNNDISLELVLKKLRSIGIIIDLEKLKNV